MSAIGTSDSMQALYDRGNDHEVECLAAMRAEDWWVKAEQEEVNLEVAGALVQGHLDGVIWSQGEWDNHGADRVLEIKSPQSWAKWERAHKTGDYSDPLMHRYAWQISVYMVATGLEAVVACVEDGQVRTFGIEVPPFGADDILLRVGRMEEWIVHRVAEGAKIEDLACSQSDYPCPVAYLHDKREVVEDKELDHLFGVYSALKRVKDDVDRRMKIAREQIDAHLGLSDSLTTEAGTATRVPDSLVTDWKATAEALAESVGISPGNIELVTKRRAGYINVTPKVDTPPDQA